jgi:hypothetical protein
VKAWRIRAAVAFLGVGTGHLDIRTYRRSSRPGASAGTWHGTWVFASIRCQAGRFRPNAPAFERFRSPHPGAKVHKVSIRRLIAGMFGWNRPQVSD